MWHAFHCPGQTYRLPCPSADPQYSKLQAGGIPLPSPKSQGIPYHPPRLSPLLLSCKNRGANLSVQEIRKLSSCIACEPHAHDISRAALDFLDLHRARSITSHSIPRHPIASHGIPRHPMVHRGCEGWLRGLDARAQVRHQTSMTSPDGELASARAGG